MCEHVHTKALDFLRSTDHANKPGTLLSRRESKYIFRFGIVGNNYLTYSGPRFFDVMVDFVFALTLADQINNLGKF